MKRTIMADSRMRMRVWAGLLTVYIILFVGTGYLAFVVPDKNPAMDALDEVTQVTDEDTKAMLIDALVQEDAEHAKQRALVNQAFNVVLGALLGFLSATFTLFISSTVTEEEVQVAESMADT